LTEIPHRLVPHLRTDSVVSEPLHVLSQPVGIALLNGIDDPGVEGPPSTLEQARVGDLMRQRVLERVLDIGEKPSLVEELSALEVRETSKERVGREVDDCLE